MPFSDYLANAVLNEIFGGTAFAAPATIYVGLSTTTPTVTGTNVTAPVGNAYARVAIANNATNFPAASAGDKANGTVITFPTATGSWGTITHFVLYDAATNGNMLGFGALTTPQSIANGGTLSFAASALTFSLT